jgi:hypothetical protein
MAEPEIPASGTVHWLGTGRSTGSGLRLVCDLADRVVLWGRTGQRAQECLARLGLTGRAEVAALAPGDLAGRLGAGDVLVSMLPAGEHGPLLRLTTARGAHFACSSYVSDELRELAGTAGTAGSVVLTEAGLDPGIDHLLAHSLVDRAVAAVGDTARAAWFTSMCGGLPEVPNEFRYRFSWAPRGVLTALCSPARYLDDGREVTAARPWEAVRTLELDGEPFDAYPNRDSIPFITQYRIPDAWGLRSFVRGTLRLDGWREAWRPVFEELRRGDGARIDALAADLAERYPVTDDDRDRVVLAVELVVETAAGGRWSGRYLLDLTGDENETAMARCVSLPLAFGVGEILRDALAPGLHRAAESGADAERWIAFLNTHGIRAHLRIDEQIPSTT